MRKSWEAVAVSERRAVKTWEKVPLEIEVVLLRFNLKTSISRASRHLMHGHTVTDKLEFMYMPRNKVEASFYKILKPISAVINH